MSSRRLGISGILVRSMLGGVKMAAPAAPASPASGRSEQQYDASRRRRVGPGESAYRAISAQDADRIRNSRQQQLRDRQAARLAAERTQVGPYARDTIDEAYARLPDVQAREAAKRKAWEEYVNNNPEIVKRKSMAQIQREVDANGGVQNWGDSWFGKLLSIPSVALNAGGNLVMAPITYFTHAPKGTGFGEWLKTYGDTATQDFWGDSQRLGHDIANNFQIQAASAGHGVAQMGRWAGRYLDPRTYGDSTRARTLRESYANTRANAANEFLDEQLRRAGNFENPYLNAKDQGLLSAINVGMNQAVGEFAGGELATMGVGHGASMLSKGIGRLGTAASTAVRGAGVAPGASRAARVAGFMRNRAASGVNEMFNTVSLPSRALSHLSGSATGAAANALTKGLPAVGRGVYQTLANGLGRPVVRLMNFARHPGQSMARTFLHPWRTARKLGVWGMNTLRPAWKATYGNPNFWQAQAFANGWNDIYNGKPGGALSELGHMGGYGAFGLAYPAGQILYDRFLGGDDEPEYEDPW